MRDHQQSIERKLIDCHFLPLDSSSGALYEGEMESRYFHTQLIYHLKINRFSQLHTKLFIKAIELLM